MFWEEDNQQPAEDLVPDDIVDLSFRISCRCLPVDHAHALSQALQGLLPWLAEEERAGVHVIHVAASGNGWFRPDETEDEVLYLSRRTRMTLRLPKERVADAETLSGETMDIAGYSLQVGESQVRPLSRAETLFARYVLTDHEEDEEAFLAEAVEQFNALGVRIRKALCGRGHRIQTPTRALFARSLMVADLKPEESFTLQRQGLGGGRKLGCGLFIPHKGIKAVRAGADEQDI